MDYLITKLAATAIIVFFIIGIIFAIITGKLEERLKTEASSTTTKIALYNWIMVAVCFVICIICLIWGL